MKRILFVGQAPPRTDPSRPFGRTKLYSWLHSIGITDEFIYANCEFGALIDFFPGISKSGGHLVPTPEQIQESRPRLRDLFNKFKPDLVVPIGKLSIENCLQVPAALLTDVIGQEFKVNPYGLYREVPVIPLPHPSGASSWVYQPGNSELLTKALGNLQRLVMD